MREKNVIFNLLTVQKQFETANNFQKYTYFSSNKKTFYLKRKDIFWSLSTIASLYRNKVQKIFSLFLERSYENKFKFHCLILLFLDKINSLI